MFVQYMCVASNSSDLHFEVVHLMDVLAQRQMMQEMLSGYDVYFILYWYSKAVDLFLWVFVCAGVRVLTLNLLPCARKHHFGVGSWVLDTAMLLLLCTHTHFFFVL